MQQQDNHTIGALNTVVVLKFNQEFGLEIPIVQGPMGGVSGPGLVAAVANSGGLGILPIWSDTIGEAKSAIEKTKNLTSSSFGVNLRADLVQLDHIKMALDLAYLFSIFFGVIQRLQCAQSIKVMHG